MVSEPTSVNSTAQKTSQVIRSVGQGIVSVAEKLILADAPWLGAPVLKQLWEYAFNWIAGYFIQAAKDGATFAIIDAQVEKEETGLSKALQALILAEKSGDPHAIENAIHDYADAQSILVHSDGSTSVH